jgi:hypothetical protein
MKEEAKNTVSTKALDNCITRKTKREGREDV